MQVGIIAQGVGSYRIFVGNENSGRRNVRDRLIKLFDDRNATGFRRIDSMSRACRQKSVSACRKLASFAGYFQFELTFKDVQKTLRGSFAEFAAGFEFGSVLREFRTDCRANVHNRSACFHAR